MRSKAFTLIETVLATIIAGILVIGAAAVLQNMQTQTAKFKTSVDTDMRWVEANRHLAENVHASSYLSVPNQDILILFNYNDRETGRYINDTVNHQIGYSVDVGNTLQSTFPGVNALFMAPSPGTVGKGWKNDKLIEVIINYSAPFTSTLRLRTAVATKPPETWALKINGGGVSYGSWVWCVQNTSDHNFILSGSSYIPYITTSEFRYAPYLINMDKNGHINWEKVYAIGSLSFGNGKNYAIECFRMEGTTLLSDGFALADTYWQYSSTDPFPYMQGNHWGERATIIRTETNGDFRGLQQFGVKANLATTFTFYSIRQKPDLTGFIASGAASTLYDNTISPYGYESDVFLGMVNEDGSSKHVRYFGGRNLIDDPNMWPWLNSSSVWAVMDVGNCVEYAFDNTGRANGYILVGSTLEYDFQNPPYNNYTGIPDCAIYIVGVDANGDYLWSRAYGQDGKNYVVRDCHAVADASGLFNGYIIAGYIPDSYLQISDDVFYDTTQLRVDCFLLRLDKDLNPQWLKTYGGSGKSDFREVKQTVDGGFIVAGYTNTKGAGDYDCRLIKTDSFGNTAWDQVYGGAKEDKAYTVQEIVNNSGNSEGYIVGGSTQSFLVGTDPSVEETDAFIFRTDINGVCTQASDPQGVGPHTLPSSAANILYNDDSGVTSHLAERQLTTIDDPVNTTKKQCAITNLSSHITLRQY